jgi:hypothetical protein
MMKELKFKKKNFFNVSEIEFFNKFFKYIFKSNFNF